METNQVKGTIDLYEQRNKFKRILEYEVAFAFKYRRKIKALNDLSADSEDIQKVAAWNKKFNYLQDSSIIDFSHHSAHRASIVSVQNSHDYKLLVETCVRLLIKEGVLDENGFNEIVENILEHEFLHHVPALEKLNVEYTIEFVEDEEKGFIGFIPAIRLFGKTTIGVYKDIVSSPSVLSENDKSILGIAD